MTRLSITAILTTHRRPELLLRALASVAAEFRPPDEILVVQDGDDPETPLAIQASGLPCRLVQRSLHSVARARNLGLREAGGDWVIYLDDDDLAYPGRCAALERAAVRSGCPLVYGATLKVDGTARYLVPTHHPRDEGYAGFRDFLRCMPHTNSILWRKADLLECGGFVESSSYFSDWCALLHVLDRSRRELDAYRVPEVLAQFELIAAGMTQAVARDLAMRDKVLEAFDCLRLERTRNRSALAVVRALVERSAPFHDYDAYVELAARHI
jgi:glycosyltransferase involved in cell wall biosynthesis